MDSALLEVNAITSALEAPDFSLFRLATLSVHSAESLADLVSSNHIVGGFFPTDEAFARLPEGLIGWFFSNPDELKALVDFHFIVGDGADGLYNQPSDLVWQTIHTLRGGDQNTISGFLVDNKVSLAGPEHDFASGKNIATVIDNDSHDGIFAIGSILFPDGLVACSSSTECADGSNCRWYSQPDSNNAPAQQNGLVSTISQNWLAGLTTCLGSRCAIGGDCCSGTCGEETSLCCKPANARCTHSGQCCKGYCGRDRNAANHKICQLRPVTNCLSATEGTPCLAPSTGTIGLCILHPYGLACKLEEGDCKLTEAGSSDPPCYSAATDLEALSRRCWWCFGGACVESPGC